MKIEEPIGKDKCCNTCVYNAKWLITPRKKLSERDKIVCSNCGGQALYELDEDECLSRALSRCCPHCGCLISDADIVHEENNNE